MAEVSVIGGGVGGMVSALLLARSGHEVRLFEQLPRLGASSPSIGATVSPSPSGPPSSPCPVSSASWACGGSWWS
ncbi:NAD(P)-binding protein [Nonomuraea recticatena]|uniref:NAD(P)-binding protein n=1 Tax=Nonomuraea recticatena TaxID=46178 RepID=UPI003613FAE9